MWDPTTYLTYADERGRPFAELVARIGAERPRAVVDLGCGPGNLTAGLAARWPDATVTGLDSSPEMIARARALDTEVTFTEGDVRGWHPTAGTDVVVSNATLQWVDGHEALLTRWAAELPAGGWLAFQVPGNFGAPSHRTLRALAADPRWSDRLGPVLRDEKTVLDPAGYAELLHAAGGTVDAWETTYLHVLPETGADHPVLSWMEGTALRPVRAALDADAWNAYRTELDALLAAEYPVTGGRVLFPFRRIFVVAQVYRRALGDIFGAIAPKMSPKPAGGAERGRGGRRGALRRARLSGYPVSAPRGHPHWTPASPALGRFGRHLHGHSRENVAQTGRGGAAVRRASGDGLVSGDGGEEAVGVAALGAADGEAE
jgi:trans-aconitate 2-methyltransferase